MAGLKVQTKLYQGELPARGFAGRVRPPNPFDQQVQQAMDERPRECLVSGWETDDHKEELKPVISQLRNAVDFVTQKSKGVDVWITEGGFIWKLRPRAVRAPKETGEASAA